MIQRVIKKKKQIIFPMQHNSTHPNTGTDDQNVPFSNATQHSSDVRHDEPIKDESAKARNGLICQLLTKYIPDVKESIQKSFVDHIESDIAYHGGTVNRFQAYQATSRSLRNRLIKLLNATQAHFISQKSKCLFFISMEYLVGRFLRNALLNMGLEDLYKISLQELGITLDEIYDEEYEACLGSGGLGRLLVCLMDALATLNYPAWGYGLMYTYGLFKQAIRSDGSQREMPDYWLNFGEPWCVRRDDIKYPVHFFGHVDGVWKPSLTINAIANDFLIPGFGTFNTLALRLWISKATTEIDEEKFSMGNYFDASIHKQWCEMLTSVLYPNDTTPLGKEMRLMQQYFMSAATLADIIHRVTVLMNENIRSLPKYAAIQLNDTHPTLSIIELLRILIDNERMEFIEALEITRNVFSYTCHTLLPEAMEMWDISLMEKVLPRHMQIIFDLNHYHLEMIRRVHTTISNAEIREISIIEEKPPRRVKMANIAIIGSNMTNGVSVIHSELMKNNVFNHFYKLYPERFCNITNGISFRRWLLYCNPELSKLLTEIVGSTEWVNRPEMLTVLNSYKECQKFHSRWIDAFNSNKKRLTMFIETETGIKLKPEIQMFDVQIKRIHEYKRQHMNIFSIIYRYINLLRLSPEQRARCVPRAVIFAGKAAAAYKEAKLIIKLINNVARVINNDEKIGDLLKVVFIPNYNVSIAEIIIPGTDMCQHISTAQTEASGSANMKFALNGVLIIATKDGATIEIGDAIGEKNVFFFGATSDDVDKYRSKSEKPIPEALKIVFDTIRLGIFGDPKEYETIINSVVDGDKYLVARDFEEYIEAQSRSDELYMNQFEWVKRRIISTANVAQFSADNTIMKYVDGIWKINQYKIPDIGCTEDIDDI